MSSTDLYPVIPGQVVEPAAVTQDPSSFAAHDFFGVLKKLVTFSGFHNQDDVDNAIRAIDAYEAHVVHPADQKLVRQEGEPANVEDVSKRLPPPVPGGVLPAANQQLDYAKLAAAIVAAEKAQQAQAVTPEDNPA